MENKAVFNKYIDSLKKDPKQKWALNVGSKDFDAIYNKVLQTGLHIDGDIVTLSYRGKIIVDYSYQAYRKKLLLQYPNSIIDASVVYNKDEFSFEKKNGKVVYTHVFANPFNRTDADIIGAYCIVKNERGEFIEVLSKSEAEKMKQASNMKFIWNNWASRMYLKSVIKRICKSFFYDEFKVIEELDNQNYNLEEKKDTELDDISFKFANEYKLYKGEDKKEIGADYKEKHTNGTKTLEYVSNLYWKFKILNTLDTLDANDSELLKGNYEGKTKWSEQDYNELKTIIDAKN